MPQEVVERWKLELEREKDEKAKIEFYKRIENYLDKGYGKCCLEIQDVAEQAQESLLHFDTIRYKLISWVIMPNHVHFLIKPINNHSLSEIIKNSNPSPRTKRIKYFTEAGNFGSKIISTAIFATTNILKRLSLISKTILLKQDFARNQAIGNTAVPCIKNSRKRGSESADGSTGSADGSSAKIAPAI